MIELELLAPAKNLELGKAAINAGADAVYIGADMFGARKSAGNSIDDIQKQVGDRTNSARKIYLSYQLIEVVKDEFDIDTTKAENLFSYLLLATGQGGV